MPATIRLATNKDVPDVVRVIRAVYDEYGFTWDEADYHADLYDLEHHYTRQDHPFFVAVVDGSVVGTAALSTFPTMVGEPCQTITLDGAVRIGGCDCGLDRLYVHPGARKQGLGRMLFNAVIQEARARGRIRMEIWSDKRFEDAHRLYKKLGAVVAGDRICHDPDQSPEWGLCLDLA